MKVSIPPSGVDVGKYSKEKGTPPALASPAETNTPVYKNEEKN